jgi:hypothetical protein
LGRHRDRTLLVLAVVLSCVLLSLDRGTQNDVARTLGLSLYAPVQALARGAEEAVLLRRDNEQLRRLVATLNLERQRLLPMRDEVAELRRTAGFAAERFPYLKLMRSSGERPTPSKAPCSWGAASAIRCPRACRSRLTPASSAACAKSPKHARCSKRWPAPTWRSASPINAAA